MYRNTAINILARRLGNRTDLDDAIADEMILAQEQLENHWPSDTLPWFLASSTSSLVTVAGTEIVAVPSGFLRELEGGGLYLQDGDTWQRLCKFEMDSVWSTTTEQGTPDRYALFGSNFYLYPIPDAAYPLRLLYGARATALSSDIENAWLQNAPELLIAATGTRMAAYVQDQTVLQLFVSQYTEGVKDVVAASLSRSLDNQRLYMG